MTWGWLLVAAVLAPISLGAARRSGWSFALGRWENNLEYILSIMFLGGATLAFYKFLGALS